MIEEPGYDVGDNGHLPDLSPGLGQLNDKTQSAAQSPTTVSGTQNNPKGQPCAIPALLYSRRSTWLFELM